MENDKQVQQEGTQVWQLNFTVWQIKQLLSSYLN